MRMALITKFTLVTSTVLALAMGLFAFFSIQALERISVAEAIKDVDNLSETILSTTYHQMLADNRTGVYQTIAEVGTQAAVRHIRLINKDGMIRYSTNQSEIGTQVDKSTEACNMCHGQEAVTPLVQASSMSRSRRFVDGGGEEVMGMARGIYNQLSCAAACHVHPRGARLLGVLDVTVSLAEMNSQIAAFRRNMALATLGLLAVLTLTLTFLTRRLVHRPVRQLLHHTRQLARGEMSGRIENVPRDELGELEEAFNDMTSSLRRVQGELRSLASSLEVKVEERTHQVQAIQGRLARSEKLASLGELVAGIAHEINNPLTGILVFSSLALENPRLHPALREDLETISRETQRCAGIVRRLLEFSREAKPEKKPESVNRILDKTLRFLENQAAFQNVRIVRHFGTNLPLIPVDVNQLKQVCMNILINAAQAMPGGGELTLSTGFDVVKRQVFASIRDTGCGIPEENLKRIFDPFFTSKEQDGTGLGLSVSFGIIENHGGTIEVDSVVGEGSTFTVVLPMESVEMESVEGGSVEGGSKLPARDWQMSGEAVGDGPNL